jgi:hypothetical protein
MSSKGLLTSMAITDAYKNAILKRDLDDQQDTIESCYLDISEYIILLNNAESELRKFNPKSAVFNSAVRDHARWIASVKFSETRDFQAVRDIEFDGDLMLENLEKEFQDSKRNALEKMAATEIQEKSTWFGIGKNKFTFLKKSFSSKSEAQSHKDALVSEIEHSTLLKPFLGFM